MDISYDDLNIIILNNCQNNNKELICTITKSEIEEILSNDGDIFWLEAVIDNYGIIYLDCILDIKINYKNVNKENIFINISDIKETTIDYYRHIAFKTDTNFTGMIKNFISGAFSLEFLPNYKNNFCNFKYDQIMVYYFYVFLLIMISMD